MSHVGDDCYFYYYSSCTKGSSCPFRHEEAALGCEVVCKHWQMGSCTRPGCKFRHMEIQVNRSNTPCYWESQPSGCTKPHCVFKHFQPRPIDGLSVDSSLPSVPKVTKNLIYKTVNSNTEIASSLSVSETEVDRASPKIEPVIVNPLEDESETESTHGTPQKKAMIIKKDAPASVSITKSTPVVLPGKRVGQPGVKTNVIKKQTDKPTLTKRRIKLTGDEDKQIRETSISLSDTDLFKESGSSRNVVIGDEEGSHESFKDFLLKKSRSSLGISIQSSPEKDTVKVNVKNRLGNAGSEKDELATSKVRVKKRLGRIKPIESETVEPSVKKRLGQVEREFDQSEPGKVSILNRLGDLSANRESSPDRGHVKSRLGLTSASARLGQKSLEELRYQKLQLEKELEEESSEEEKDIEDTKTVSHMDIKTLKSQNRTTNPTDLEDEKFLTDIKVKSLAEIRAEKARKAELTKNTPEVSSEKDIPVRKNRPVLPPAKPAPKRKIMVYTELFEDSDKKSPPPADPEPTVKVKSLDDIRAEKAKKKITAPKKERQIYMPPAMKNTVMAAPIKRTITPPPSQPPKEEKQIVQVKPATNVSVKTFSEIMAEKRRKQQELRAKQEVVKAEKSKIKCSIQPIVFDAGQTEQNVPEKSVSVSPTPKQTVTVNPLKGKAFQAKENVSLNITQAENKSPTDTRLMEGHVLGDNNSCDNVIGPSGKTLGSERVPGIEAEDTKRLSMEEDVSPPKRRTSSHGSDMPTKKKSRQSVLSEDDDDFFFGDDLDDFEDAGKIDEGDLLQDIDELLA